jgi:hypothetical protein
LTIKSFIQNKQNNYFHSTFINFDKFDINKSPFGMHFGTRESAENRVNVKILEDERLGGYVLSKIKNNPILIEASLDCKNPLELNENRTGRWYPHDVLQSVIELAESTGVKGISEEEIEDYYCDELSHNGVKMVDLDYEDYGEEEFNTELKEHLFIRDWLESKGYDSITYNNEFEGGGKSIIVFRENQIKIISKTSLSNTQEKKNEIKKLKHN